MINTRLLRDEIANNFNLEELELLCADIEHDLLNAGIRLPVNLEIVGGDIKEYRVYRLIQYLDSRRRLQFLIEAVRRERPGLLPDSLEIELKEPAPSFTGNSSSAQAIKPPGTHEPETPTKRDEDKEARTTYAEVERRAEVVGPLEAENQQGRLFSMAPAGAGGTQLGYVLAGHTDKVRRVAFSPDGQLLASASFDNTVRVWRSSDGYYLHSLRGHTDKVQSVAFSPDGQLLASASSDDTVRLWWAANGRLYCSLRGHMANVRNVTFSPDGELLASVSSDTTVRLWRVQDGSSLQTLHGSTDRDLVSDLEKGNLRLTSRIALSIADVLPYLDVAFTSVGPMLATYGLAHGAKLQLWRLSDGMLLRSLEDYLNYMTLSPDGELLAGATNNGVRVWRVSDGELRLQGTPAVVRHVAFSPDGKYLAAGGDDNMIQLWEGEWGSQPTRTLRGHMNSVNNLAFSPDSRMLASAAGDKTIRIWRSADGKLLNALEGHMDNINSIAFSPDGTLLASGSDDNTVRLWSISEVN